AVSRPYRSLVMHVCHQARPLLDGSAHVHVSGGRSNPAGHRQRAALTSQEWASSHRISNVAVDDLIDETIGDLNSDTLPGVSGVDLFIINTGDTITNFQFGKPKSHKDRDVVIR